MVCFDSRETPFGQSRIQVSQLAARMNYSYNISKAVDQVRCMCQELDIAKNNGDKDTIAALEKELDDQISYLVGMSEATQKIFDIVV